MPTIKDVAKFSGVSVATVSRAVNNSGYVHEDTRKKIDEAIRELNYRPNETARSLYNKKSKIIGLLLPDISNPFFTRVARGVEDAALDSGYHVIIGNSDQLGSKELKYIDTFKVNNCAGFISATLQMENAQDYIESLDMEHVTLDRTNNESYSVEADHFHGGMLQAQCLLDSGCKNILVVHGNLVYSSFQRRLDGSLNVLKSSNIDYEVMGLGADDIAEDLLKRINKYDGLICYNDMIAIQLMGLLQNHGISVPGEVQVIGYDDIQLSGYTYPSLTTIHQPAYQLGRIACNQMIKLLNNESIERNIIVEVDLIERNSTRSDM